MVTSRGRNYLLTDNEHLDEDWQPGRRKKKDLATDLLNVRHTAIVKFTSPGQLGALPARSLHGGIAEKLQKIHFYSGFQLRFLEQSNQFAVDVSHTHARDHLIGLQSLAISGKATPVHAYEIIRPGQIRGVIYRAKGVTCEQLMANLTCYSCKIISARPMGANGAARITI
ncbi:hypothetical protein HPB48_011349 [Haemaphysalis longicornis]|uniref:Uncharacterized protein n=1 Tax=Haemaphysalis longicornis TaxID=44386 RepID=A0A9J6G8P9_HAELO|nr:hypothetical protein HPB48_011349 [Haemaphysalis longicornis]